MCRTDPLTARLKSRGYAFASGIAPLNHWLIAVIPVGIHYAVIPAGIGVP